MEPFIQHSGIAIPIDRANVDTDAILPKQYLKSIRKSGYGGWLFDDWRYLDSGDIETPLQSRRPNPEFVLNDPRYRSGSILLARENFGCGSSREHAVWALRDFGVRAVVAPSFADIFCNNCTKNGILPVVVAERQIDRLFKLAAADKGAVLEVNLESCVVRTADGKAIPFTIEAAIRERLLRGEDDISITLRDKQLIAEFERTWHKQAPWLTNKVSG